MILDRSLDGMPLCARVVGLRTFPLFVILKIRFTTSAEYKIPAKLKVKALIMLDTWYRKDSELEMSIIQIESLKIYLARSFVVKKNWPIKERKCTKIMKKLFRKCAVFNLSKPTGQVMHQQFNLLKTTVHVMRQQFNIQQLYVLPTLYLCVLCLSENKQRLVPLTA